MNYSQLPLDSWIQTTIPYDSSYHIKDVLNEMIRLIQQVVDSTEELQFDYEINTFKQKWYTFVYQRYYLNQTIEFEPYDSELYQYFGSKFSDELQELFTDMRNITHRYNVGSLIPMDSVKATSVDIEEFLFDILLLRDPYVDSDEETLHENEENLVYSIDGSYI